MEVEEKQSQQKKPSFFKWRFRIGGLILIALGAILIALRGLSYIYLVLPVIGVILLAVGWLVIK